jgi:PIF1-like helicase
VISFFGPCQQITISGQLAVTIDNIVFCAANNTVAHSDDSEFTSNADRNKRRKFAGRAPPRKVVSAEKSASTAVCSPRIRDDRYVNIFTVSDTRLVNNETSAVSLTLARAILAPTHNQVDEYNDSILRSVDGAERTYLAADSLKEADDSGLSYASAILDYVARQTPPGLPSHKLLIKMGAIYRLLRNISTNRGLVENARVVVTGIGTRLITVRIVRDHNTLLPEDAEDEILIPRMTFTHTLHSGHTLCRHQFPLMPA